MAGRPAEWRGRVRARADPPAGRAGGVACPARPPRAGRTSLARISHLPVWLRARTGGRPDGAVGAGVFWDGGPVRARNHGEPPPAAGHVARRAGTPAVASARRQIGLARLGGAG